MGQRLHSVGFLAYDVHRPMTRGLCDSLTLKQGCEVRSAGIVERQSGSGVAWPVPNIASRWIARTPPAHIAEEGMMLTARRSRQAPDGSMCVGGGGN
jgi:hypothetical protein